MASQWVLDVAFPEDESRVRRDHGPENLVWLRRVVVSLPKNEPSRDCNRKIVDWD